MRTRSEEVAGLRLGAIVLASIAGMALGLLGALLATYIFGVEIRIARLVFGGSLSAALVAAIYPSAALDFVETTVHFFIGFLSASAHNPIEPNHDAPPRLKAALLFGVFLAIALLVLSRF